MTDLNKEREAFLNTFQYYKGRRDIIFSHEHELFMTRSNNPSDIAQKEISNMNSRWDAWLRCAKHRDAELEKAKAQAVPEGYKLVPVELYNFQANRLAEEEFNQNKKLFDMEHRGLSGTEVELRKLKWLQCKAESIKQNYRRLVNWASESGAEG